MSNQPTKILFFLVFLLVLSIASAPATHAMWMLNKSGELRYIQGEVLGETTGNTSSDLDTDEFKFDDSLLSDLEKVDAEVKNEELKKSGLDSEKLLRIEPKNGKLGVKANTESPTSKDVELDEGMLEIETENEGSLKIATGSGSSLVIIENETAAQTGLPVLFDTESDALFVEAEAGAKTVKVLPDALVTKLKSDKVVDVVLGDTNAPKVEGTSTVLLLEMQDGKLVYRLKGVRNKKILWLFPVSIQKDLKVSAEDGSVVSSEIKSDDKWKDMFSF